MGRLFKVVVYTYFKIDSDQKRLAQWTDRDRQIRSHRELSEARSACYCCAVLEPISMRRNRALKIDPEGSGILRHNSHVGTGKVRVTAMEDALGTKPFNF